MRQAAYACSKHACEALTRSLAWELEPAWPGLRVVSVAPGAHATPLYAAVPGTVARAARQRGSEHAAYGAHFVAQLEALLARAASPGGAGDPARVVDALEDALASRCPPARYTVGLDAWAMRGVACLPHCVHDAVWPLLVRLLPPPGGRPEGPARRRLLDLMMAVWGWLASLNGGGGGGSQNRATMQDGGGGDGGGDGDDMPLVSQTIDL